MKRLGLLFSLVTLLVLSINVIGCSGKPPETPVDVVSVDSSGVKLTEDDSETDPLDWPSWRGPNGSGIASDRSLPQEWSNEKNIDWAADVPGRGHSSPTVVGDHVFLATALDHKQKQLVVAYGRKTGEKLWETEIHSGNFPKPGKELHPKGTNANSTIACDGKSLFIGFLNSQKIILTKLNLDGKIAWQKDVGAFGSKFGYAPSPVLYKSFVIVAADNFGGGYIAALDKESGKLAWRIKRPALSSYSSPAILKVDGKDQLVISGCKMIESYDPANGKLNWSINDFVEATCGTCVSNGKYIYASGGYPEKITFCVDGKGKLIWKNATKAYEPSLIIVDKNLVTVADDGIVSCVDLETGESHWKKRLPGGVSASPILCNGLVYSPSLKGETRVFKATSSGLELIATNSLDNDTYASPAIAGNAIYLRTGSGSGDSRKEKLYRIQVAE